MSKNYSHSLDRELTKEELDELNKRKEHCCALAVEEIKMKQGTARPQ